MNKQFTTYIKKTTTFLLAFSILSLSKVGTSFADDSTITYDNYQYDQSQLSQESVDWIKAYNAMPDDKKMMINHVPYELRALQAKSAGLENRAYEAGSSTGALGSVLANTLPLSGGEAAYNPDYWNSSENIRKANCYAYAMDVIFTSGKKLQPGELAGAQYTQLTASNIIAAVKKDGPYLGNGRTIVNSSDTSTSTSKSYKTALVLDTSGAVQDYHWYVQNSNGYWSHKPGFNAATDLDASGNYITNPKTCNRDYGYAGSGDTLNYSTWGGFLMVTRK